LGWAIPRIGDNEDSQGGMSCTYTLKGNVAPPCPQTHRDLRHQQIDQQTQQQQAALVVNQNVTANVSDFNLDTDVFPGISPEITKGIIQTDGLPTGGS